MATIIATPRLLLREWGEADIDACLAHLETAAVRRWLGPSAGRADYIAARERSTALQAERGHCFWILERKEDGAFLGFCGIKLVNATGTTLTGTPEIGWRLREDVWGQGYAREAAVASLDFAFDRLGAPLVVAFTVAQNEPSWRLMERLGMRRRPDLDFDDPAYDHELNPTITYALAPEQLRR